MFLFIVLARKTKNFMLLVISAKKKFWEKIINKKLIGSFNYLAFYLFSKFYFLFLKNVKINKILNLSK